MRLTCPNCGARYEIDDALIPAEGRDVQCSNCSTNWFQSGAVAVDPLSAAPASPEPSSPAPEAPRRELDPSLRALLREEAEREERLRREEAEGLERQDEMALQDPAPTNAAAPEPRTPEPQTKDRATLLPDIEEINASLQPQKAAPRPAPKQQSASQATAPDAARRKGRNAGLLLSLGVGMIAIGVYSNAAQLGEAVPTAAPYLTQYANGVEALRDQILDWLRETLPALQAQIKALIASFTQ